MEWELEHEGSLLEWLLTYKSVQRRGYMGIVNNRFCVPWILQDMNYYNQQHIEGGSTKALVE
jgi:hypothetical protein